MRRPPDARYAALQREVVKILNPAIVNSLWTELRFRCGEASEQERVAAQRWLDEAMSDSVAAIERSGCFQRPGRGQDWGTA